jgi:hypothetical protein
MSDRSALDLFLELTGGGDDDSAATVTGGDIAAAGNGGTADASANGGAIAIGDVNSGGNSGGSIAVGDVGTPDTVVYDKYGHPVYVDGDGGAVAIDGGDVTTSTSLGISADGGVAIADASGGDGNFAFVS